MSRSIRCRYAIPAGLFAAMALLSGASIAADAAPGLFALDADRNGSVSHDEFVSAMKARFGKIDRSGNGKVTPSELRGYGMQQMMSASRDPVFARDRGRPEVPFDKNGEVDFPAFSLAMTRLRFDPVDTDRDRILSSEEIKAETPR